MLSGAVVNSLTTCSGMRLFTVQLPWPPLKACSPCRARSNSGHHIEDVAKAHRGRGGIHRPWATHSRVRLLAVRIPSPPPEAWPPCWARSRRRAFAPQRLACGSHGRRRGHALHAGRAGGARNRRRPIPTRSMRRRSLILAAVGLPGRCHTFVPASARIGFHNCRRGMRSGPL